MPARLVNWGLYWVTFVLIATGVATLATSRVENTWLYDLHRYSGALLCLLLIPKFGIIARAYARRIQRGTWNDLHTWAGLVLTILLLVSIAAALLWTLNLAPFWVQVVLYVTPLAAHWYLALALVPFFLWHIAARRITPPNPAQLPAALKQSPIARRHALSLLGIGILGIVGLGALNVIGDSTWRRRFTGSRLVTEFSDNDFPVTQSETPPTISADAWELVVQSAGAPSRMLNYAELLSMSAATVTASLDCTLGWASTQHWRGVRLTDLLALVGASSDSSVAVYASSGAFVLLPSDEIGQALVATHVGSEPLAPLHGFPARLVVPSRRGYQWLKWINRIVVQDNRVVN